VRALSCLVIGGVVACAAAPQSVHAPPVAAPPLDPPAVATSRPASCSRRMPAQCEVPAPFYATDVRPILEHRCFSCHANEGVATESHDFARFATLYAQRADVADEVVSCAMPPPGKPQLSDAEAAALLRWIACGATGS
jgi:uncharacterized membrane protein